MARSRRADPVEKAIQELHLFYELGRKVLLRTEREQLSAQEAARAIAQGEGLSLDRAKKASQFARNFSDRAFERLCQICRSPSHAPLSINHVRAVLRISDQAGRLKWLRQAAREGWTAEELAEAIRGGAVVEGRGGPRIKTPENLSQALSQILRHTDDWLKRYDDVWGDDKHWPPIIGFGEADPSRIARRVKEVQSRVARLEQASQSLAQRLRSVEGMIRGRAGGTRGRSGPAQGGRGSTAD